MILVVAGDAQVEGSFVGQKLVAKSPHVTPVLQSFIDEYEATYIRRILGVELGNLLIEYIQAGSGSNPPEERFDVLIEPFQMQDEGCHSHIYESKGLADALTSFIYFHFICDTQQRHGQSGVAVSQSDTANVVSPRVAARKAESIFNTALDTVEAIQHKCRIDPATYPEYRGIKIEPEYGSLT